MSVQYYWGTGRRKTAVARVRLRPQGEGQVMINGRQWKDYVGGSPRLHADLHAPLRLLNLQHKYDVMINVNGGGIHGQVGAMRHGIARALLEVDPSFRHSLKSAGYLTRDPRVKERKKYGRKKARKRFQFSKR
ncbi:30S ribosomal protein S9 [bacterium (Candidatus Blackallbacteria) CG17_big_fil_post_rev_8_21_14_2_50_48_46]|uniref:Small ribosomal subunit protein uS9 n=1 Tax=bacterium (Candidatus Blackallbacteria) CG17_big_fil_post_rev_8_21_14_2_50_48_46 TaxID=2014261 RepID=A0A2M7FXK7_9BACT|nr:MAG: 30S ribosomal protein S9 [bacterium (Candidatus Blackallbacteria) CG18_big_fil_WC_8_21_14_2_50_49_26]PIW13849.1 MAG: 30S ribosomal protein S9 [bacterium (Candidatus Blackallbacteria) CG17_big_fil_post_rev_8_21_14_2_50_48_46]PIW45075.1 MAG: 30S ribosomal protein S9 [bacterium (Candidatus Blackallbacteria) CG13_big_fil_rev_8_21_14_2_50_49_14]